MEQKINIEEKNNITLNEVVFFGKFIPKRKEFFFNNNLSFMGYNKKGDKQKTKVVCLELGIFFAINKYKHSNRKRLIKELDYQFNSMVEDVVDTYSQKEMENLEKESKEYISQYWEIFKIVELPKKKLSKVYFEIFREIAKDTLFFWKEIILIPKKVFLETHKKAEQLEINTETSVLKIK